MSENKEGGLFSFHNVINLMKLIINNNITSIPQLTNYLEQHKEGGLFPFPLSGAVSLIKLITTNNITSIPQLIEHLEKYKDGSSISFNKDSLREVVRDILKDEVENSVELLPKLMKRPEMLEYIKEKVNEMKNVQGSGINNEELSEQEQIEEAIEFLEGKGFKFL